MRRIAYDTIRYDTLHLRAPKSWLLASVVYRTEPKKHYKKRTKNKNRYRSEDTSESAYAMSQSGGRKRVKGGMDDQREIVVFVAHSASEGYIQLSCRTKRLYRFT